MARRGETRLERVNASIVFARKNVKIDVFVIVLYCDATGGDRMSDSNIVVPNRTYLSLMDRSVT